MVARSRKPTGYWKYKPEPLLRMKHPSVYKISMIMKKLGRTPLDGTGRLTAEERGRLHPELRDRIPVGSTRRKLSTVGHKLHDAEEVLRLPYGKIHHLDATIDATGIVGHEKEYGKIFQIDLSFKGHPEAERVGAKLASRVFVSPLPDNKYLIISHGTQGSTKLADLPAGHKLHHFYDYTMPMQELALTTMALGELGKNGDSPPRVFVVGQDIAAKRMGINRPSNRESIGQCSSFEDELGEKSVKELKHLAENWDSIDNDEKEKLTRRNIPWQRLLFIPHFVLERNYHDVPTYLNRGAEGISLGFIAPKEVLERIDKEDIHGFGYHDHTHLMVHELRPGDFAPMTSFLRQMKPPQ